MKKAAFFPKKITAALLIVGLVVLVLGCKKKEPEVRRDANTEDYEVLEIRHFGSINNVYAFELAEDLGFLAPLKLKYLGGTGGGPQSLQALQSNQIDICGTFLTAMINLNAANGSVITVIGYAASNDKTSYDFYVLENSPIKSGRDLIGKKIAVNTFGAANEALVKEYLFREGLTKAEIDEVELIVLPAASFEQALRSKQVDGIILNSVAKERALRNGGIRSLFNDGDIYGDAIYSVWVMRKDFTEKYPNTTRKLVGAIAQTYEWTKVTPVEEIRSRMQDIMIKRNREEEPRLLQYWHSYGVNSKGAVLSDSDIQLWIDWLVRQGDLEEGRFKPSDLYTNEFNPYWDGSK